MCSQHSSCDEAKPTGAEHGDLGLLGDGGEDKRAPVPAERVTGRAGRRTGAGAARQSNLNTRRTTDRPLRFIVKSSCLVDCFELTVLHFLPKPIWLS